MSRRKSLRKEIEEGVAFDGIFCESQCRYKSFEYCALFAEKTGYNFKLDRAKRTKKCKYYFKEEK